MDYYNWLSRLRGCLQDMNQDCYEEVLAKHLYEQGYEPAEAAAELCEEE
jgi:hypothetical protein